MQFKLEDTYSTDPSENSWRIIAEALKTKYEPINPGNPTKLVNGGDLYWPGHYEDFLATSRTFPHIAFKISGREEKYNDYWWLEFFEGREVNRFRNTLNAPLSEYTLALASGGNYKW